MSILSVTHHICESNETLGDVVKSGFIYRGDESSLSRSLLEIKQRPISRIPVVRIFGREHKEHKSCTAHVHGILPELYIPWPRDWTGSSPSEVDLKLLQVGASIEAHPVLGTPPIVFGCFLVKGIPFFGYHPTPRHFIKILLLNPSYTPRVVGILSGTKTVLGRRHQPYNAHFPFDMQVMLTLGITGMGDMTLLKYHHKQPKLAETYYSVSISRNDIVPGRNTEKGLLRQRKLNNITQDDLRRLDTGLLIDTLHGVWSALEPSSGSNTGGTSINPAAFSQDRDYRPDEGPVEKMFRNVLSQLNPSQASLDNYQRYIPASDQPLREDSDAAHWCYTSYDVIIKDYQNPNTTQFTPLDAHSDSSSDSNNGDESPSRISSTLKAMIDLHEAIPDSDTNSEVQSHADSIDSGDVDLLTSMVPNESQQCDSQQLGSIVESQQMNCDGGLYDYNTLISSDGLHSVDRDVDLSVSSQIPRDGVGKRLFCNSEFESSTGVILCGDLLTDGGLPDQEEKSCKTVIGQSRQDAISVDDGSHVSNTPPSEPDESGGDVFSTPPLQQWSDTTSCLNTPQVVPGRMVDTNPVLQQLPVDTPASSEELFISPPTGTTPDEVLFPTPLGGVTHLDGSEDQQEIPIFNETPVQQRQRTKADESVPRRGNTKQAAALSTTKKLLGRNIIQGDVMQREGKEIHKDTKSLAPRPVPSEKMKLAVLEALAATKLRQGVSVNSNQLRSTSSKFQSKQTESIRDTAREQLSIVKQFQGQGKSTKPNSKETAASKKDQPTEQPKAFKPPSRKQEATYKDLKTSTGTRQQSASGAAVRNKETTASKKDQPIEQLEALRPPSNKASKKESVSRTDILTDQLKATRKSAFCKDQIPDSTVTSTKLKEQQADMLIRTRVRNNETTFSSKKDPSIEQLKASRPPLRPPASKTSHEQNKEATTSSTTASGDRKKKTSSLFKSPTTNVKYKHSLIEKQGHLALKVRKVDESTPRKRSTPDPLRVMEPSSDTTDLNVESKAGRLLFAKHCSPDKSESISSIFANTAESPSKGGGTMRSPVRSNSNKDSPNKGLKCDSPSHNRKDKDSTTPSLFANTGESGKGSRDSPVRLLKTKSPIHTSSEKDYSGLMWSTGRSVPSLFENTGDVSNKIGMINSPNRVSSLVRNINSKSVSPDNVKRSQVKGSIPVFTKGTEESYGKETPKHPNSKKEAESVLFDDLMSSTASDAVELFEESSTKNTSKRSQPESSIELKRVKCSSPELRRVRFAAPKQTSHNSKQEKRLLQLGPAPLNIKRGKYEIIEQSLCTPIPIIPLVDHNSQSQNASTATTDCSPELFDASPYAEPTAVITRIPPSNVEDLNQIRIPLNINETNELPSQPSQGSDASRGPVQLDFDESSSKRLVEVNNKPVDMKEGVLPSQGSDVSRGPMQLDFDENSSKYPNISSSKSVAQSLVLLDDTKSHFQTAITSQGSDTSRGPIQLDFDGSSSKRSHVEVNKTVDLKEGTVPSQGSDVSRGPVQLDFDENSNNINIETADEYQIMNDNSIQYSQSVQPPEDLKSSPTDLLMLSDSSINLTADSSATIPDQSDIIACEPNLADQTLKNASPSGVALKGQQLSSDQNVQQTSLINKSIDVQSLEMPPPPVVRLEGSDCSVVLTSPINVDDSPGGRILRQESGKQSDKSPSARISVGGDSLICVSDSPSRNTSAKLFRNNATHSSDIVMDSSTSVGSSPSKNIISISTGRRCDSTAVQQTIISNPIKSQYKTRSNLVQDSPEKRSVSFSAAVNIKAAEWSCNVGMATAADSPASKLQSALRGSNKTVTPTRSIVRFEVEKPKRSKLRTIHGCSHLKSTTPPPLYAELLQSLDNEPHQMAAVQEVVGDHTAEFLHSSNLRYRPIAKPPTMKQLLKSGFETTKGKKSCILSNLTQPTAMFLKSPINAGRVKNNKGLLKGELPTLITCCLDVVADTGDSDFPDPKKNEILSLAMCVHNSADLTDTSDDVIHLIVMEKCLPLPSLAHGVNLHTVESEQVLVITSLRLLSAIDPDILMGWDLQRFSFGYLNTRALLYNINISEALGRVPPENIRRDIKKRIDSESNSVIKVFGRVTMNCWRTMRSELRLASDTLQAAVKNALGKSIPKFSHKRLSMWHTHSNGHKRSFAVNNLISTIVLTSKVCCHLDTINRTVELARLYGIQFTEILTRGSQFRVENMFVRLAKPLNYLMISPSRQMVEQQNRQEGVPFVMEPHSNYYTDPVIVLDFRSLYPSIVIAYNLCYSTCVGKISSSRRKRIGPVENYNIPKEYLNSKTQKNETFIAPNSCGYIKPSVRRGLFPRMLAEILGTRFAVQEALKQARSEGDVVTASILNARQIGLKMIANVTYGYTAATMSGRMPCSDIADSIVLLARQTLERIIKDVEANPTWHAKVIYGDTDSLFVCLPGSTLERAFDVGRQIVEHASATNPSPVKLKLEKVYKPCIMVTKKRYVGNSYETLHSEPKFDAKGLECVRRDQCKTTSKVQEAAIRKLFETNSLSKVREYVQHQLRKIQVGNINSHDLILRQEVKLGTYANPSQLPPSATVAREMIKIDPLSEPLFNERVPYLVANSKVVRLSDMVVHPLALLSQKIPSITINATYYITKQVCPPLDRVLSLAGGKVGEWLITLPRSRQQGVANNIVKSVGSVSLMFQMQGNGEDDTQEILKCASRPKACTSASGTLHDYVATTLCVVCRSEKSPTARPICTSCSSTPTSSKMISASRKCAAIREMNEINLTCSQCAQTEDISILSFCSSMDCTVPWRRQRAQLNLTAAQGALELW